MDATIDPIPEQDLTREGADRYREAAQIATAASDYVLQGWCRHVDAVNAAGECVSPQSERAVAWCAVGAVAKAVCTLGTAWDPMGIVYGKMRDAAVAEGYDDVASYNDAPDTVQGDIADLLHDIARDLDITATDIDIELDLAACWPAA